MSSLGNAGRRKAAGLRHAGYLAACLLWLAPGPLAGAGPAYLVEIQSRPPVPLAGASAELRITVRDAATGAALRNLQPTHEELFHLYIVSEDLRHFTHSHAQWDARGYLRVNARFPKPGLYRLLSEFQPAGAAAQLVEGSLHVSHAPTASATGASAPAAAAAPAPGPSVLVSFRTEPFPPQPGIRTPLIFTVRPADGLEKFHGDWGQLLAVSDDLIDLIRAEPAFVNAGMMQFNVYFPRPRGYRIWMEYRHSGVLRLERLDLDVREPR